MRRVFGVAALCLFVCVNVSAADWRSVQRDKEGSAIVRMVKRVVRTLGDMIVTPRP